MRIERFHIKGFKSIADVEVSSLSDINVFYGLNDVGKSNLFQALSLWRWLLEMSPEMPLKQLEEIFGPSLFSLRGDNVIQLEIDFDLERSDLPDRNGLLQLKGRHGRELISQVGPHLDSLEEMRIVSRSEVVLQGGRVQHQTTSLASAIELQMEMTPEALSLILPRFHIVQATRRFHDERKEDRNHFEFVSDRNLKQALFYAYLSPDTGQKRRLAAIKRILSETPVSLGALDVALDPVIDRIDIGFVRTEGRLPLENLGSGSQQLLMILGQIFLNDYPIIAIEEPEMNLSPQYQQHLLVALRRLMQDPDVELNQLFISTHSPYFEFEENFFDVALDEQGNTQVVRLPIEKRARYFPDTRVGPETGARLNSLDQVKLYDGVIKDLGLERGDLVLFVKNEAGRWEIRPEAEIIQELDAIFDSEEAQ